MLQNQNPFFKNFHKMKLSGLLLLFVLIFGIVTTLTSARPSLDRKRLKRQSDQRIAELETLLALQKYGQHRLREWGRGRDLNQPGFGLIDVDKIGRRKKSTTFSGGDYGNKRGDDKLESDSASALVHQNEIIDADKNNIGQERIWNWILPIGRSNSIPSSSSIKHSSSSFDLSSFEDEGSENSRIRQNRIPSSQRLPITSSIDQ